MRHRSCTDRTFVVKLCEMMRMREEKVMSCVKVFIFLGVRKSFYEQSIVCVSAVGNVFILNKTTGQD